MSIEQLYDDYAEVIYRFFYIKTFDRMLAEDLTSQTYIAVVERMKDETHIIMDHKKFLYGVMRNIWLMHLREKYRRHEVAIETIEDFEKYVERDLKNYDGMNLRQRAMRYIALLPEKQRAIVEMRLIHEMSVKEIMRETGKDRNYIKTTYRRGLSSLREAVNTRMLEQEEISV